MLTESVKPTPEIVMLRAWSAAYVSSVLTLGTLLGGLPYASAARDEAMAVEKIATQRVSGAYPRDVRALPDGGIGFVTYGLDGNGELQHILKASEYTDTPLVQFSTNTVPIAWSDQYVIAKRGLSFEVADRQTGARIKRRQFKEFFPSEPLIRFDGTELVMAPSQRGVGTAFRRVEIPGLEVTERIDVPFTGTFVRYGTRLVGHFFEVRMKVANLRNAINARNREQQAVDPQRVAWFVRRNIPVTGGSLNGSLAWNDQYLVITRWCGTAGKTSQSTRGKLDHRVVSITGVLQEAHDLCRRGHPGIAVHDASDLSLLRYVAIVASDDTIQENIGSVTIVGNTAYVSIDRRYPETSDVSLAASNLQDGSITATASALAAPSLRSDGRALPRATRRPKHCAVDDSQLGRCVTDTFDRDRSASARRGIEATQPEESQTQARCRYSARRVHSTRTMMSSCYAPFVHGEST